MHIFFEDPKRVFGATHHQLKEEEEEDEEVNSASSSLLLHWMVYTQGSAEPFFDSLNLNMII